MNFRYEIQDIFRSKGINSLEANKAIFGIATIGLLIGKDMLDTIIHDAIVMEDKKHFEQEICLLIQEDDNRSIAKLSFTLIPYIWDGRLITRITEIILHFDLKHIVLDLNIFENTSIKDCPLTNISYINELVIEILKAHGGKTLYNVDCGTSDFIMEMFNKSDIEKAIGNTFIEQNFVISQIKAYFSEKRLDVKVTDLFTAALENEEKVDMVYNAYPLMLKYDRKSIMPMINSWTFPFNYEKKYSSNLLWIINSLQSIKPNGIIVALVPNGVLFNNIDVDIRRYLIEYNYIDTIISLPSGILSFSNVATSLIILKKQKSQCHTVRMIDATDIFSIQKRCKILTRENIEYIVDLYTREGHTEKSFDITIEEIANNDFYLGINRYCTYSLINPCALGDVTRTIFRGYQINAKELDEISIDNEEEDSDYRIINISDIQAEGFVTSNLKPVKIDNTIKFNRYCVKDGDIIITAKNTTIKSAIYKSHGDYKAILSGNLIAIRVNETKIDPYYLKAFLDSKQGQMALKSIQTGTTLITLNPNSLKDMKVSLLDMPLQVAISDEYRKNLNNIEELLNKYNEAFDYASRIYDVVMHQN